MNTILKKVLQSLLAITLLLGTSLFFYDIVTTPQKSFLDASVKVIGNTSHGSGVILDSNEKESLIITNKHVCKGAVLKSLDIQLLTMLQLLYELTRDPVIKVQIDKLLADSNGKVIGKKVKIKFAITKKIVEGTIQALAESDDLCLIRIKVGNLHVAKISNKELFVGQRIITHGHPLMVENHITEGFVGEQIKYRNEVFVHHTATVLPGNSGSGAFNMNGQLVGINTRASQKTPTINLMIPFDLVELFMYDFWLDGRNNEVK